MDAGDIAGAVLKAGSLSGLAAFAWQLWNAYDNRRARLAIEAVSESEVSQGEESFLAWVSYTPKDRHQGLEVRATVLDPPVAKIAAMERNTGGPRSVRMDIENAVRTLQAGKVTSAPLHHRDGDPDGMLRAPLHVTGLDGLPLAATVRVEVWTTGYPRRLASRRFKLSPIG